MRLTLPRLVGFLEKPITSCSQLLITKKPVDFDYVALDASGLVGGALRLSKYANSEQRRHKEVGRHVVQGIQQVLKRVNCRAALLIALDGAEPLAKAAATRSAPLTRRLESRLARLPGTALMQAVEERLVRMMPDRAFLPREVIIAGTGVTGCVEEKMTAWALDLACRADFHGGSGQSLALIGPQELYLNALALTPYYNVSSLVQGQGADMRHMTLTHMLEWLGLDELAMGGSSETVARARTDAVFLLLLCHGSAAADLPAVAHLQFSAVFAAYRERVLHLGKGSDRSQAKTAEAAAPAHHTKEPEEADGFLFADVAGNKLALNLEALAALLAGVVPANARELREDVRADGYLELALQSHTSLCLGSTADPLILPPHAPSLSPGTAVTASQLCGHVLFCVKAQASPALRSARSSAEASRPREDRHGGAEKQPVADDGDALASPDAPKESSAPLFSPTQPLTAAEFTVLSHSTTPGVEAVFQLCMNGAGGGTAQRSSHLQPLPELLKRITAADTQNALRLVRSALSFASAHRPHPSVCFSPAYYWRQNPRSRQWRMSYVDVGRRSAEREIRRVRNAVAGVSMVQQATQEGPAVFSSEQDRWVSLTHFPFTEAASAGAAEMAVPPPRTLKVLTWNVMFDRYSGQPTPLGMPGIDWCSPKRYPVLAKLIAAEEADVVGMQEVEPAFLQFLAGQRWCRESYVLSCTPQSGVISPWGVAMLVRRRRLAIAAITHVNVPAWSGHVSLMPVVTLTTPDGGGAPVHVAAVHLLAPFTKNHEDARTGQDQALRQKLTKGIAGGGDDCIAMGDFNDWPANEFLMPPETQYRECWPLVHPRDRGSTIDESNAFCKLKIEEMFFGRSDKVFLRSQRWKPVEAHLVGTRSVNDENGNTDAPAYLFPSDHYGVSMTFALP